MLGRIAAINGIFVTSSNELGALHSTLMTRFHGCASSSDWWFTFFSLCCFSKIKTKDLMRFHF
jgi:hypothetical protein